MDKTLKIKLYLLDLLVKLLQKRVEVLEQGGGSGQFLPINGEVTSSSTIFFRNQIGTNGIVNLITENISNPNISSLSLDGTTARLRISEGLGDVNFDEFRLGPNFGTYLTWRSDNGFPMRYRGGTGTGSGDDLVAFIANLTPDSLPPKQYVDDLIESATQQATQISDQDDPTGKEYFLNESDTFIKVDGEPITLYLGDPANRVGDIVHIINSGTTVGGDIDWGAEIPVTSSTLSGGTLTWNPIAGSVAPGVKITLQAITDLNTASSYWLVI